LVKLLINVLKLKNVKKIYTQKRKNVARIKNVKKRSLYLRVAYLRRIYAAPKPSNFRKPFIPPSEKSRFKSFFGLVSGMLSIHV